MSVSRRAGRLFLMLAVSWFLNSTAQPQTSAPTAKKLKIYISVDMEGVAGVVTADQLGPTGFEYERFRQFMTNETLAAVRAAKESGATAIVVSDSHGNGENLLIEEFPKDVHIIRSWPRHGSMMAGVDASFDAALVRSSCSRAPCSRAHRPKQMIGPGSFTRPRKLAMPSTG